MTARACAASRSARRSRWRPLWPPSFLLAWSAFATFQRDRRDERRRRPDAAPGRADAGRRRRDARRRPAARRFARAPPGLPRRDAVRPGQRRPARRRCCRSREPPAIRRPGDRRGFARVDGMQAALAERAQRRDPPALSRDRRASCASSASTRPASSAPTRAWAAPIEPVAAGRQCRSALPRALHHLARSSTSSSRASPPSPPPARSRPRSTSPAAMASAPIPSAAAPRCMPASISPARSAPRSTPPPTASSAAPNGIMAATAISSRSTTARASRPATATCRACIARPGQRVRRGELIGLMGSTGRSTGSHLHYEVRIDGRAVNPIPFMQPAKRRCSAASRSAPRPRSAARPAARRRPR